MGDYIFKSLMDYYHALELKGYMSHSHAEKLLVLLFLWEYVSHDFRCTLSRSDYHLIEVALECLYGSSCLIPYPDYLKMGKLHLGSMTELSCRVHALEEASVLKLVHDPSTIDNADSKSDVLVMLEES